MMNLPVSQQLASVLLDQLIDCGVRELVVAPGSRSAPLAYAAWTARDRLRIHVRIDERSAAFLALGLAKASDRPVPVVTTSGTAAGNLLPAVMEAYQARVPLVAITADHPATMINSGANQTADQFGLFGRQVRAEARLSAGDAHPRAWAFAINRALAAAVGWRGSVSGPVHIEAAFIDPLTPEPTLTDTPGRGAGQADWTPINPGPADPPQATPWPVPGKATVIVAGDLPPSTGQRLAEQAAEAQVPLLAEPSSNARHSTAAIATYRTLLADSTNGLADGIEQVVMVGRPTLSRPIQRLLSRDDIDLTVVESGPEWIDPGFNAARVVPAIDLESGSGETLYHWQVADRSEQRRLAAEPEHYHGRLNPRQVAQAVVRAAGPAPLVFGSSNPIRDADLAVFPARPGKYYANRGLAGIDGTLSTTIGIALHDSPDAAPTWALCGDLTFLHDSNGLLIGPEEPRPDLRIVVINDDGGSIFATLEHGRADYADSFERIFGTPHHTDLGALCRAHGVTHTRITEMAALHQALAEPVAGIEVVEAVCDRAHRHRG